MTTTRLPAGPPIVLVEGSADAFERAAADVQSAGWRVTRGFDGPRLPGGRETRLGAVASADDAAKALLAVLGGAGVVIHGVAAREIIDRLIGDLRHVGPVDHRRVADEPGPALDADARAILRCLAEGQTLGEAASALGLSRRTADRRLAEARAAFGVERTVEAVARARKLGWLRRGEGV